MKILGIAAAAALAMGGSVHAAQTPIAVTGFNQSTTIPIGGSTANLTATYDGGTSKSGFTFYEIGENANAPLTGIPSGSDFVSAADNTTTFHLQPAGGSDSILVGSTSQTLTLTASQSYSTLSFLSSTGSGNGTVGYVVNFADGATQSGTFASNDWFGGSSSAVGAGGRVTTDGKYDAVKSPGNDPNLYQYDSGPLVDTSAVTSIDFTQAGGSGNSFVWAVSGTVATPEPASFGFLAAAAVGLLGRRRRNA